MPAITTLDTFLDLLRRSGAIDPRRLDSFLATKYGGQTPDDPPRVAEDLITAGLLTRYHTEPLLAGRPQRYTLSGKYRMIDRLGSGGMASVFLCEHRVMRRRVAVKMLPPSVASNASALDRFHREARAMAGVHHPNIVGAHDVDNDGKIHFIVMEYVDGTNFHELVRRVGPLPLERAAHYNAQAARGLQHAHDKGLVHRDIKPANLLLDRTGLVKILDLGLALVFQSNDDNLTRDHDANSILGTAEYLAPEQAVDSHNVDHRADIYSLGMTMYFILTAQTPFGEGTTAQKLIWHQLRQPKPIREHRPDLPEELWTVMAKMLAKDPAQRYQTMQEVSDALTPWTANPIPPPAEREMPKPLADLSADPMPDMSGSSISYPSSTTNLPSPLEATPSDRNGRSSGTAVKSPPPVQEVSFAMPGGLEAATSQTLPVSAAPTDAKRSAGPGSGGAASKPAVAAVAAPSAPTRPKLANTPPAVAPVPPASAPKSAPAASSAGAKKASSVSGVVQKAVVAAMPDDDEDVPRSKPKSKKIKKKPEKKSNTMVIAAAAGGGVALLAALGLVFGGSGGSKPPVAAVVVTPSTQSQPSAQTQVPSIKSVDTPPVKIDTGPFKFFAPELVNVVVNGRATASLSQKDGKDPPQAAFDNDFVTKWTGAASAPWWVQYEFPPGVDYAVSQYGVVSAEYKPAAGNVRDRDPKNWQLQGSQDGTHFDILDTRTDQKFQQGKQLQVYTVAKPAPYRFYRLYMTANTGNKTRLLLAELALRASAVGGATPQPPPPVPDGSQPTETLPEPRTHVPPPSTPAEPTVTADFFPVNARTVYYLLAANNAIVNPAVKNQPYPWVVITQKWEFREPKADDRKSEVKADGKPLADIAVTSVKQHRANAPNGTPNKPQDINLVLAGIAVRLEKDTIRMLTPLDPRFPPSSVWMPILKIGAKKGENWTVTLPNGDTQTYTVTEFGETDDGRKTVTVKTDRPYSRPDTIAHFTHKFVQGVGEVERIVTVTKVAAPDKEVKDYELRHKDFPATVP